MSDGRDPYYKFWDMTREEAAGQMPLYYCIGKVLEASEQHLRVLADGHELDEEDILVNDFLKPAWEETAEITLQEELTMSGRLNGISSFCQYGTHVYFDVTSIDDGKIEDMKANYKPAEPRLKANDLVLLIPDQERQIYYLVMKVVSWTDGAIPTDQSA